MAKYERAIRGNFHDVLAFCEHAVMSGSISASLEDGSDFRTGDFCIAVRVFERYSAFGSNRVSLNLTLAGVGQDLFLTAITAGGSQAMFFKLNTVGEETFLNTLARELEAWLGM